MLCKDAYNLVVGQEVPVKVNIRNRANHFTTSGQTEYVSGKLKASSSVQIVFACLDDGCRAAEGDALEYTGKFEFSPTHLGASMADAVKFEMGREKGSAAHRNKKGLFSPTEVQHIGGVSSVPRLKVLESPTPRYPKDELG